MGNSVELRGLIKSVLNTNCVDPYDPNSTRRGNHFFDESDNLNLTRGDTFPKGYIKVGPKPAPVKQNLGPTGHIKRFATIDIFYYAKEKSHFTTGSITYREQDLVNYMLDQVEKTLLSNAVGSDYHLMPSSFGDGDWVKESGKPFTKYRGLLPVTYYWNETY